MTTMKIEVITKTWIPMEVAHITLIKHLLFSINK
jgi:hypothetical protein